MNQDHRSIKPFQRWLLFLKKNREVILYLFFGGTAFFLNIGLFWVLDNFTALDLLINNGICWVVCVLYQFVTNKNLVFQQGNNGSVVKQLALFTVGRVITLVIEDIILAAGIDHFDFPELPVKLVAQVIIIILNYVISKFLVFRDQHHG